MKKQSAVKPGKLTFIIQLLILIRCIACLPFFLVGMVSCWVWFYTIRAASAGWSFASFDRYMSNKEKRVRDGKEIGE
jgi:hypothetical protein